MNREKMEISQMLQEHPIKAEKEQYRIAYINVLEYFTRKYSADDLWTNSVLNLYKLSLLDDLSHYNYVCQDIKKVSRTVLTTKFRHFKFFSYRFSFVIDCIYLNAMTDREKADAIFSELVTLYNKRYHKKITYVYEALFDSEKNIADFDRVQYMWSCWNKNINHLSRNAKRVIVTANMSAGKSTLLNAIIGRKVNKTQNDSCTAKVHYLLNKPYEDGFDYEWDFDLNLNADYQALMDDNENNQSTDITVGCHFRSPVKRAEYRTWFIDTPGVNSSQDEGHRTITEQAIADIKSDILLYLLNGENIGTEDDKKHLQFVKDNYHGPILFVVNKVDRFRKKDDSVPDTIKSIVSDLEDIGFESPTVVPVSSYAGYLAKMKVYGDSLNEDEQDEFENLLKKLSRDEYQFDTYYPAEIQGKVVVDESDDAYRLLKHSGILQLETMLYEV